MDGEHFILYNCIESNALHMQPTLRILLSSALPCSYLYILLEYRKTVPETASFLMTKSTSFCIIISYHIKFRLSYKRRKVCRILYQIS